MDYYLDLRIRPDPELASPHLLAALFAKLHHALVAVPDEQIGISFPAVSEVPRQLGNHLRLHGTAQSLQRLMALPWLGGLRDHLSLGELLPVPASARHRSVRRVQVDSNPGRQRRRLMKRHGLSEEEARQRIPDSAARETHLPFVHVNSQSRGQRFLLFIEHGPLWNEPTPGRFTRYGLGDGATIPWF